MFKRGTEITARLHNKTRNLKYIHIISDKYFSYILIYQNTFSGSYAKITKLYFQSFILLIIIVMEVNLYNEFIDTIFPWGISVGDPAGQSKQLTDRNALSTVTGW